MDGVRISLAGWPGLFRWPLRIRYDVLLGVVAVASFGIAAATAAGLQTGMPRSDGMERMSLAFFAAVGGGVLSLLIANRTLAPARPVLRWHLTFSSRTGKARDRGERWLAAPANAKYARMLGYLDDELPGKTIDVFLPPGLCEDYAKPADELPGRYRYMVLLRHREGYLLPVVLAITVAREASGALSRRFVDMLDLDEIEQHRNRLVSAKNFFWKVFDATPVGMVIVDKSGRYTRVNRAMCDFTAYSEGELRGRSYRDITHPGDNRQLAWLAQAAPDPRSPAFQIEKRYVRKDGKALWAVLVALPLFDGEGNLLYWVGQVLDIDRIKRVEQTLRIAEQRFRGVFENANTGMVVVDPGGRVRHFNDAFRTLLGYDRRALRRMRFDDFTPAEDRTGEPTVFDEILRGGDGRCRLEKRWLACDGRVLWVDLHISAIRNEGGEVLSFVAVVGDMTERKRSALALADSRRKLRALAAYQEGMLELERKHIAREVHDEMGQLLTALKMDLSLMRLRFGQDAALLAMIDEMRQLVERTIDVTRQVASNLRPAVLDHGLLPAIEWLADDFYRRTAIPCRLACGAGPVELNEAQATAVFRVVQESLTNVVRHAQARSVVISLRYGRAQLHVVVKDDGRGFDPVVVGKARGFGLFGMRERILALGGTLRIKSAVGQGTAVSIRLPLATGERE